MRFFADGYAKFTNNSAPITFKAPAVPETQDNRESFLQLGSSRGAEKPKSREHIVEQWIADQFDFVQRMSDDIDRDSDSTITYLDGNSDSDTDPSITTTGSRLSRPTLTAKLNLNPHQPRDAKEMDKFYQDLNDDEDIYYDGDDFLFYQPQTQFPNRGASLTRQSGDNKPRAKLNCQCTTRGRRRRLVREGSRSKGGPLRVLLEELSDWEEKEDEKESVTGRPPARLGKPKALNSQFRDLSPAPSSVFTDNETATSPTVVSSTSPSPLPLTPTTPTTPTMPTTPTTPTSANYRSLSPTPSLAPSSIRPSIRTQSSMTLVPNEFEDNFLPNAITASSSARSSSRVQTRARSISTSSSLSPSPRPSITIASSMQMSMSTTSLLSPPPSPSPSRSSPSPTPSSYSISPLLRSPPRRAASPPPPPIPMPLKMYREAPRGHARMPSRSGANVRANGAEQSQASMAMESVQLPGQNQGQAQGRTHKRTKTPQRPLPIYVTTPVKILDMPSPPISPTMPRSPISPISPGRSSTSTFVSTSTNPTSVGSGTYGHGSNTIHGYTHPYASTDEAGDIGAMTFSTPGPIFNPNALSSRWSLVTSVVDDHGQLPNGLPSSTSSPLKPADNISSKKQSGLRTHKSLNFGLGVNIDLDLKRLFMSKEGREERDMLKEGGSRGKKKKLVIKGIAGSGVPLPTAAGAGSSTDNASANPRGLEKLKEWCESFGQIRSFTQDSNGDIIVDFSKASVADRVCCLGINTQVHIRGVGSVTLSYYTGKISRSTSSKKSNSMSNKSKPKEKEKKSAEESSRTALLANVEAMPTPTHTLSSYTLPRMKKKSSSALSSISATSGGFFKRSATPAPVEVH